MGSHQPPPLQLPTIDFSNITKNDRGTLIWDSTKTQVFKAFQEYGCFETFLNQISPEFLHSVFTSAKQLFNLPLETKLINSKEIPYYGYLGPSKDTPLFESIATPIEHLQSFTNLMWPHGNHDFYVTMKGYSEKLSEVDEIVRMMVLESLNLDKYMVEHMELMKHVLTLLQYRIPNENESSVGLRAHTDKNFVSILHENDVAGLDVQNKDGEWIRVKNSTNSFVVMIGESFYAWTNGRLRPSIHKVTMTGDHTRYSIGYFSVAKKGKFIETPNEMVDDEHPLLFNPYEYEEFLKFLASETDCDNKSALEKYCGVKTN